MSNSEAAEQKGLALSRGERIAQDDIENESVAVLLWKPGVIFRVRQTLWEVFFCRAI